MSSPQPIPVVVRLKQGGNPWSAILDDDLVEKILLSAAILGEEQLQRWIAAGQVKPGAVFAQVFLDPTKPRHQDTIKKRIFATVLYGDLARALECLPNAAGKADATDRHGRPNGDLVNHANFCLGNGDFAWGKSVSFWGAVSAGSGLSETQDGELALIVLESAMRAVHEARARWIEKQRRELGRQGWYNPGNVPGEEYQNIFGNSEWRESSSF